ncbi:putative ankyrin repeat protein RF_0381 [Phymastichus coffea]|uniref:putative ankyrin repeat protein RF_0381 n=1 Tax=Phymastichus coffea TaxID=108790 RepID=UPI00273AF5FA|nr:putative ankyrin repeat protein RF_0381 [Phymastichus coffea]
MSQTSVYNKLLIALRDNDLDQFCTNFNSNTLPEGFDYDLLVEAMMSGCKDFVFYLLDKNCKTNKEDNVNTLVHVALTNGWLDVVKKLLELDVPVSRCNSRGNTAVHVAFNNGCSEEIINCLLECYFLETLENIKNVDGLSILHIICTRPNVELFKKLVYKSVSEEGSQKIILSYDDLNGQVCLDSNTLYAGYTPLHFAVQSGCIEIIKNLIYCCHIDICKQDASFSTPLHLALQRRDIDVIDILLADNTVYKDYVNSAGLTHVMAACASTIDNIATNFLNYTYIHACDKMNSIVNARVQDLGNSLAGYTPFHFAAEYGRFQTVQLLYYYESMIFAKTSQGLSALVLAIKNNHHYIAHLIFNYYKAYRESICNDKRDVIVKDIIPFIENPTPMAL